MTEEAYPLARDKAELMQLMRRSRDELDRTLSAFGETKMTTVQDHAGWSVKDHIAHIVAWEQSLLRGLAGLPEHEAAELAHYSVGTADIEYAFPFLPPGEFGELEGVAHRADFDLRSHMEGKLAKQGDQLIVETGPDGKPRAVGRIGAERRELPPVLPRGRRLRCDPRGERTTR